MRVFLTGHDGFIGRWLTGELLGAGHDVFYLDYNITHPEYWATDRHAVAELRHLAADAVVHLAARVGRENCERDPMDVIATNAGGTMNVAKACRAAGVPLVYVSSSEAADGAGNLYGLTKRWGEDVARLYAPDRLQIARLFMPYGPGHPPGSGRAALVNFLDLARRGEPIVVHRGTERPWCWVGDTVNALRLIIERQQHASSNTRESGRVWDVGRWDNVTPMISVAHQARAMADSASEIIEVDPPPGLFVSKTADPHHHLQIDLGWRPTVDLSEGMGRTLQWLEERDRIEAANG